MFLGPAGTRSALPYSAVAKTGSPLLREEITAIDPETHTVTTDAGTHREMPPSSLLAPITTSIQPLGGRTGTRVLFLRRGPKPRPEPIAGF